MVSFRTLLTTLFQHRDYAATYSKMINECKRDLKRSDSGLTEVLSKHLPDGTEENLSENNRYCGRDSSGMPPESIPD
jgi:hypothetical protein